MMAAIPGEGVNVVVTAGMLLSGFTICFALGDFKEADARLIPPPVPIGEFTDDDD